MENLTSPSEHSFYTELPEAIREALSHIGRNSKSIHISNVIQLKIKDKILRELKERERQPKFKIFDLGEYGRITIKMEK